MSKKQTLQHLSTDHAPAAVGPYSQAVSVGNLVFISGQLPINPSNGLLIEGNIAAKARQCLENISAIAAAAGTTLDRAVKVTIFLTDMEDFGKVNDAYAQYFQSDLPARSAVQVAALPKNAAIEIEAVIAL